MSTNKNIITPFPTDTNRQEFGNWLSGFTDGEGCFCLPYTCNGRRNALRYNPSARFTINLRADDINILRLIQSYWQCGSVRVHMKTDSRNPNPKATYNVHDLASMTNILIPHFEAFPLRAKKARDFVIWKQAVNLLFLIAQRPRNWTRRPDGNRGFIPHWTPEETYQFLTYRDLLQESRNYTTVS